MVDTGGRVRGLIGRWLMRLEAASGILRVAFLGITAASTLSTYLAVIGLERYAPLVIGAGGLGTLAFAWGYAETGVYNRKNRERADYGQNYSGPSMLMDDYLIARGIWTAEHGRPPTDEEDEMLYESIRDGWEPLRDGVDVE